MTHRNSPMVLRILLLLVVLFVGLFLFHPVSAQSPAILNGCFSGGYSHWQFYYSGWAGNAWDVNGVNGCGRVKVYGVLVSSPFLSDGGSVTFSAMSDTGNCCGTVYVKVVNYDTGVASLVASFPSLGGTWISESFSMSGFSGSHVALMFSSTSGAISNVVASGSALLEGLSPSQWNGTFTAQVAPSWVYDTSAFVYNSGVGHTVVGSMMLPSGNGSYHVFFLAPVVSDGSDVSFWYKGSASGGDLQYLNFVNVTYPSFYSVALPHCDDWCQYVYSLGGTAGDVVSLSVAAATTGSLPAVFFDDFCMGLVCSTSGNGGAFNPPTPTPVASATSSGGGYPTQIPYLTQIPPLTQIPYPTPVCGQNGTPCPVSGGGSSGLCPPTDPCYVLNPSGTPIQVFIDGGTVFPYGAGTPIPIQGGNSTPVIVAFPTSNFTPIAARTDLVTVGGYTGVADTNDWYHVPLIDIRNGASTQPVQFSFGYQPVHLCLPSEIAQVISISQSCVDFSFPSIGVLQIGSVNLLQWFTAISAVLLFVFIVRQLQER